MTRVSARIAAFESAISSNNSASIRAEYTERIRPAYVQKYGGRDFPRELVIDDNPGIDGFGSPGLIMVSQGVANEPRAFLRTFAVAHESGHAVAYVECQRNGANCPQPFDEGAKRHEHLADLIAMRVLKEALPDLANRIFIGRAALADWLGFGDAMHPSGDERVEIISRFYLGGPMAFSGLIKSIVDLSKSPY